MGSNKALRDHGYQRSWGLHGLPRVPVREPDDHNGGDMIIDFVDGDGGIGRWETGTPPRVGEYVYRDVPRWLYIVERVVWTLSRWSGSYNVTVHCTLVEHEASTQPGPESKRSWYYPAEVRHADTIAAFRGFLKHVVRHDGAPLDIAWAQRLLKDHPEEE